MPEPLVEEPVRSAGTLEALREALGDCRRCKLCAGRTKIVFGDGNPEAELMFVGEGPGEDEDRQGIPFVGRAGALLTDIITKGMGLRREDVYIANVVKCRPPSNRNPEPDEIVLRNVNQFEVLGSAVKRIEIRLIRQSDATALGRVTHYVRPTENVGVPILARHGYSCPTDADLLQLASDVFYASSQIELDGKQR